MAKESNKSTVLVCLLLAGATLAVYWPVTGFESVGGDDSNIVYSNPIVLSGLTLHGFRWALTTFYYEYWHPLTWLSHMLDCQLFGPKPGPHHLVNLVFHIANSLLLFLVLRRMTQAVWRSALVAALFALHPLHVESVAWIAERKDVLGGFFFMLTLWAYTRYAAVQSLKPKVQSQKAAASRQASVRPAADYGLRTTNHATRNTQHAILYYLLCLFFFALGLMSKPMVMTLPFVLLLLDYWPLERSAGWEKRSVASGKTAGRWTGARGWGWLVAEKTPFFLLTAASCAITYTWARNSGNLLSEEKEPWGLRLANVPVSYARYLGKMIWPVNLAFPYPMPRHWAWWQTGGAVLVLVVITLWVVRRARSAPYLIVGWLMFLGVLVPTIRLFHHGFQSIADRYTYLPSIGIFMAVVWAAAEWGGHGSGAGAVAAVESLRARRQRYFAAPIAALAIIGCAGVTRHQLQYWRNSDALIERAVAVTQDNYLAEEDLGVSLAKKGAWTQGRAHIEKALRINPDHANAHFNLGFWLAMQGKPAEAAAQYREAIRLRPVYPKAMNNLAWILATHPDPRLRNGPEALRLARRAVDLSEGNDPEDLDTLGAALAEVGRFPEAVAAARTAARIAQASGAGQLGREIEAHRQCYERGQPLRDPSTPEPKSPDAR